jgi:hypothetical protein
LSNIAARIDSAPDHVPSRERSAYAEDGPSVGLQSSGRACLDDRSRTDLLDLSAHPGGPAPSELLQQAGQDDHAALDAALSVTATYDPATCSTELKVAILPA